MTPSSAAQPLTCLGLLTPMAVGVWRRSSSLAPLRLLQRSVLLRRPSRTLFSTRLSFPELKQYSPSHSLAGYKCVCYPRVRHSIKLLSSAALVASIQEGAVLDEYDDFRLIQ
ncbi:hypothetical protein B0H12DRAFT_1148684 [Mycena haematopus]|nr:hypothetical protein B0H12DRAFT_1148684 [Mycena haematopus]